MKYTEDAYRDGDNILYYTNKTNEMARGDELDF